MLALAFVLPAVLFLYLWYCSRFPGAALADYERGQLRLRVAQAEAAHGSPCVPVVWADERLRVLFRTVCREKLEEQSSRAYRLAFKGAARPYVAPGSVLKFDADLGEYVEESATGTEENLALVEKDGALFVGATKLFQGEDEDLLRFSESRWSYNRHVFFCEKEGDTFPVTRANYSLIMLGRVYEGEDGGTQHPGALWKCLFTETNVLSPHLVMK